VLTDFKRWSVWEINGEPQADESFHITRVVNKQLGLLSGGINVGRLQVIYGHLYALVQSSLQTLCDLQNGAAQWTCARRAKNKFWSWGRQRRVVFSWDNPSVGLKWSHRRRRVVGQGQPSKLAGAHQAGVATERRKRDVVANA
jgi:hypothetical protein